MTFEPVDFVEDPLVGDRLHRVLASARRAPGGAWGSLVGQRALVVTGFDELRTFLADDEQFPGGPVYEFQVEPVVGRTFISADGDEHQQHRQRDDSPRQRAIFDPAEHTNLQDRAIHEHHLRHGTAAAGDLD